MNSIMVSQLNQIFIQSNEACPEFKIIAHSSQISRAQNDFRDSPVSYKSIYSTCLLQPRKKKERRFSCTL